MHLVKLKKFAKHNIARVKIKQEFINCFCMAFLNVFDNILRTRIKAKTKRSSTLSYILAQKLLAQKTFCSLLIYLPVVF